MAGPLVVAAMLLTMLPTPAIVAAGAVLCGLAFTSIDAFHKIRKHVATFANTGQWVCWAALGGRYAAEVHGWAAFGWYGLFAGMLAVGIASVGWDKLILRWQWGRDHVVKMQQRRFNNLFKRNWKQFLAAAHIPKDTGFIRAEATNNGSAHIVVSTPGDARALVQSRGNIATTLKVNPEKVATYADKEDNSVGHIYIQNEDPFKEKPVWPFPDMFPSASIKTKFPIGQNANGLSEFWSFIGAHWLITGQTRSGKTQFLQVVAAWVTACINAELWVIDTAKRGADFGRWEHASRVFAINVPQADTALRKLYALMEERYTTRRQLGHTGNWDPATEGPQIICIIDEAANAVANAKKTKDENGHTLEDILRLLMAEASGAGITMIVGTQTPQHKIFDINSRRNAGNRLALNCEYGTSDLTLGPWASQGFDAAKLPKGGHAYAVSTGWEGTPRRIRTWWVEDHELNQQSVARATVEHEWPHPLVPEPIELPDDGDDQWVFDTPSGPAIPDMPIPAGILTNPQVTDVRVDDKPDRDSRELPGLKYAQTVLDYVSANPGCCQADVQRHLGMSNKVTARDTLRALVASGHLRQQGRAFAVC